MLATTPQQAHADRGFALFRSDGNALTGNTASGNGGEGFALSGDSDGNTLQGNWAIHNSGDGFRLDDVEKRTFYETFFREN